MGALAGLLQSSGYRVRGSDEGMYPPMSDKLREWGVETIAGFAAENLKPHPDLIVVGNVIRENNPEAVYMRENGIPHLSMAQAVAEFAIRDRKSLVVAGTHGKTTTTALTMHLLRSAKRDPSFFVGGALKGYAESFHDGTGTHFVIEGDEYDTAYFDKGPKFLHYKPQTTLISSLEFDHADIFTSIEDIENAFAALIETTHPAGTLVLWAGAERALRLADALAAERQVFIFDTQRAERTNIYFERYGFGEKGMSFVVNVCGKTYPQMRVPLWGEHNARNVLAAIALTLDADLSAEELTQGFASFAGIRRRLDRIGSPGGIHVVDDFAHHPTAVKLTIGAARQRWPNQKIWCVFEPRSATTRRNVFQDAFSDALMLADKITVASHERLAEIPAAERFDPLAVVKSLNRQGRQAFFDPDPQTIIARIKAEAKEGDVILICSNGSFGGLHQDLLKALDKDQ
jgi:UDP-N-acetylmuramate: L-alanyl-gamma-D-glutamyl-meso-diaminopimelate ligase